MKICVVGAGGIGSHLIPMLTKIVPEDAEISVMDGDTFEEKNLDRQIFSPELLGQNKAVAMGRMYDINPMPRWLRDEIQLEDFDVIICCPDNNAARIVALDAVRMGKEVIVAGNEARSANAMYYSPRVLWCDPRKRYPNMLNPDEVERISCHEAAESAPQTQIANSMAASFAVALFMYWTEIGRNLPTNIINEYAPVEYIWGTSAVETIRTSSIDRNTGEINEENERASR